MTTAPRPCSDLPSRIEELACRALECWGVTGSRPILLKHRENAVFRVTLQNGRPAALRVHRRDYHSEAALLSELNWMAYLQSCGFPTPAPQPTLNGSRLVKVATPVMPEERQVDCLSWIEGKSLGESRVPLNLGRQDAMRIFARLGETIAIMHNLTEAWRRPSDFTRHAWDFEGFLGPRPIWGAFAEAPFVSATARETISLARAKAMRDLAAYETSELTFGLIHADLVRENLLLKDSEIYVIDYDDCGFGWYMYDIAVALYQNLEEKHYLAMRDALLSGYTAHRSLTQRDFAALPLFLTLRAFGLIGWVQSRIETETSRSAGSSIGSKAVRVAASYLECA